MSVVEFPRRPDPRPEWREDELRALVALVPSRDSTWATGSTERGEPQFYILGPAPDRECLLCVSRLAQGYVLQDGAGHLIGEARSLDRFAVEAARAAMRGGRSLVARLVLFAVTVRLAVQERVEPIVEESEELLMRFAPQIAALV